MTTRPEAVLFTVILSSGGLLLLSPAETLAGHTEGLDIRILAGHRTAWILYALRKHGYAQAAHNGPARAGLPASVCTGVRQCKSMTEA